MLNLNASDDNCSLQDPVSLNVGGEVYTTTLDTVTRCRDSMLGAMFTGQIPVLRDNRGNVFIDRDGKVFRYILNYLRSSSLDLPEGFSELALLRREADFFQIRPLLEEIHHYEASVPLSLRGGPLGAMIMVNVDSKVRVLKLDQYVNLTMNQVNGPHARDTGKICSQVAPKGDLSKHVTSVKEINECFRSVVQIDYLSPQWENTA